LGLADRLRRIQIATSVDSVELVVRDDRKFFIASWGDPRVVLEIEVPSGCVCRQARYAIGEILKARGV
jgi:hypothetical protein